MRKETKSKICKVTVRSINDICTRNKSGNIGKPDKCWKQMRWKILGKTKIE